MNRRQFICAAVGVGLVASQRAAFAVPLGTKMTVYKDPNYGCCHAWAEAMTKAGFKTEIKDNVDLAGVKLKLGVPAAVQGCHTATIGTYFIEGHVPLEAVEELMENPRDIAGLAVAGMPSGSLGMGNDPNATYDVYEVSKDGKVSVAMKVGPRT
jgi:hypothetical protein